MRLVMGSMVLGSGRGTGISGSEPTPPSHVCSQQPGNAAYEGQNRKALQCYYTVVVRCHEQNEQMPSQLAQTAYMPQGIVCKCRCPTTVLDVAQAVTSTRAVSLVAHLSDATSQHVSRPKPAHCKAN